MINYGKGISKTNEAINKAGKAGKSLMGSRQMPVVKAAKPSKEKVVMPPTKPAAKKKK
jgi:hypothetical protein